MYWIIVIVVTILGAAINLTLAQPATVSGVAEISLLWLLSAFYGIFTLVSGLQHLLRSEKIAQYIGWTTNGFQKELGWASVGLGIAGALSVLFRGTYFIAPSIVGAVFYAGAALVHAQDMRTTRNFKPGNAGPVFYIDILVPLTTVALLVLYAPWH